MSTKSLLNVMNVIFFTIAVFFVCAFCGCKKNVVDFSKYDSEISPLIVTPLGKVQLTMRDLIKEDSLIKYDSSGLIRFFTSNDSIYGSKPSDMFDDFELRELKSIFKLNNFVLPGVDFSETISLRDMFSDLSNSEKEKIEPLAGKFEIFPSLVLFSYERNDVFNNVDFKYLDFSKGILRMTFSNNLPTKLQNVLVNVYDTTLAGDEIFIGAFEFPEILPLSSKVSEIDLKGLRLTNKLSYVLVNIETVQTPIPVLINLNDNVKVAVNLFGATVVSGFAKLPQISLPNQLNRIDLSSNFPDVELKEIGLLNSKFSVKMESSINSNLKVNLVFPDISINGKPLDEILLDNQTNNEKILDVSGSKIFLGSNLSKPYNNLRVVTTTNIDETPDMVYFDSSDNITMRYGFSDFNIDYIKGYFGNKTTTVNLGVVDLTELANFTNNVTLNNPKININILNSIGIPCKLRFNLTTYNSKGESMKLELDDQEINFPNFVDRGTSYFTNISIDTSNSNIVSCLSLPANRIIGNVEVITNFEGRVYDNYIDNNSSIKIGYEIDVPLRFTMRETNISDTFSVVGLLSDLIQAKFIELIARTQNELPFDAKLSFVFTDSAYNSLDSLGNINLISAAEVDVDGEIVKVVETETIVNLTDVIISKIRRGLVSNIILKIQLNSGGLIDNKVVALNSNNKIVSSIAFRLKI